MKLASQVRHRPEDGVERGVQMFAEVRGKESQDMTTMFLKQGILAAVATVSGGIGEVLRAVDLDGELGIETAQAGGFC